MRGITGTEQKFFNHLLPELLKAVNVLNETIKKSEDIDLDLNNINQMINSPRPYEILGSDFFRTVMGQRFFNHSIPKLIKEIEELNKNLKKKAD